MTPADPALGVLWRLTDEIAARTTHAELRREVTALRDGLGGPLRLAVVGSVSAGKSTLVNAILRIPVAPVAEVETTWVTTWLEHGSDHGRVRVDGIGGSHVTRLCDDGTLPADLGMPKDEVERIRIELDLPVLRGLTLIDTPGADTTTALNEERAQQALRQDAQAILYLSSEVSTHDKDELEKFRRLCADGEFGASNALLVLTKVDDSGSTDPWPAANKRVESRLQQIRGLAFGAVAVAGAVAMTARARLLDDTDLAILHELAALDADDREFAMAVFLLDDGEAPGTLEQRDRLSDRLRLYGITAAVDYLHDHPGAGLDDLYTELERCSGFDTTGAVPGAVGGVAEAIEVFTRRAHQLTARAAVHRLYDLQAIPHLPDADRRLLAGGLARLDDDPEIRQQVRDLRVTQALDAVGAGLLRLDAERYADLLRLTTGRTPAERLGLPAGSPSGLVVETAQRLAGHWRRFATVTAGTAGGRHADHILDAVEELAQVRAGSLPPIPFDGLDSLLTVRAVPEPVRTAARALHDGACLGEQVGLDATAAGSEVAGRAATLAGTLRLFSSRPLRPADLAAVEACIDAFEAVWAAAAESM